MKVTQPNINKIDPKLTIALPVFNGGSHLGLAVQSIINQTFKSWELIILDDGSTDDCLEKIKCLDDDRIIIVRDGLNKGISVRLNQAIDMARGSLFARMDHDDICHPNRFERQVSYLDENLSVDLLATSCVTMDEQGRINGSLQTKIWHKDICAYPWLKISMPHPTWVGRIEWFRKNRYSNPVPYCCDDNELLLRAYSFSCYHCLPENLLAYRVRSSIQLKKLFRTRVAQCSVQLHYFIKRKLIHIIFLVMVGTILRMLKDLVYAIFFNLNNKKSFNYLFVGQESIYKEWGKVISDTKKDYFNLQADNNY